MERKLQEIKQASISRKAVQPAKREILWWKPGTMNSEALQTYCHSCCRFIRKLMVCMCEENCKTMATKPPEGVGNGLSRALEQQSSFPYSGVDFPSSCRGFWWWEVFGAASPCPMKLAASQGWLLAKVVYTDCWLQPQHCQNCCSPDFLHRARGTRDSHGSQNISALQGTIHKYWGALSGEVFPPKKLLQRLLAYLWV